MRGKSPSSLRQVGAHLLSLLLAAPAALWILRHEKLIQRHGRKLRPAERKFAAQLGLEDIDRVKVCALPRIPSPFGGLFAPIENMVGFSLGVELALLLGLLVGFSLGQAAGVTLGYGIYLNEDYESHALVCHELVHVQQYERLGGPLPFIRQYFYECVAVGYPNSPLEREAVELSGC